MELLGILLFDDDFYKMIVRFLLNLFFLTAVVKYIYYKRSEKKEYLFTFYLIGIVVFFLCFTLKKYELDLGMALGLFAIFGILRYRTLPLEVREMTYLFVVIGIAVMNGLSNKKMSYAEIIAANAIIVFALYVLERYWANTEVFSKEVLYETIENIKPENHKKLKDDLEKRLGVTVIRFEIGNVNFLRDVAKITVHYKY